MGIHQYKSIITNLMVKARIFWEGKDENNEDDNRGAELLQRQQLKH